MSRLLAQQDRDILLNICQYGMSEVWSWGRSVGGHFWRSGDDIGWIGGKTLWDNVERWGFSLAGKEASAGPGGMERPGQHPDRTHHPEHRQGPHAAGAGAVDAR